MNGAQRLDLLPLGRFRLFNDGQGRALIEQCPTVGPSGLPQPTPGTEGGPVQVGVAWDEPHDIEEVWVRLAEGGGAAKVLVQYWQHTWPQPHPDRFLGARRGWIGRDDPYHGQWLTARGAWSDEDGWRVFRMDPLDLAELRRPDMLLEAADLNPTFRRALKLRLLFGREGVRLDGWRVLSPYRLVEERCAIRGGDPELVEVARGRLLDAVAEGPEGMHIRFLRTDGVRTPADATLVTVRGGQTFTFCALDLASGPICVPDLGVVVQREPSRASGGGSTQIYDRRRGAHRPLLLQPGPRFHP